MRNLLFGTTAMVVAAFFVTPASAALTFDTALTDPPGTYFGSGNTNDHWTRNVDSGVELGVGTLIRYLSSVAPDAGTSTYHVGLGNTLVAGKSGSLWGFKFSFNAGTSGLLLSQIATHLTVLDVSTGNLFSSGFDPKNIPDNSTSGLPANGFQNSEALSFTNGLASLFDTTYNSGVNDTFIITFSASRLDNGASLGSVTETVIAGDGAPGGGGGPIPEPASIALLGMALAGIGAVRRRKAS